MTITAITNVSLIDGTGQDCIDDAVVLIENNHILAAGSAQSVSVPNDATIIDGGGQFLLPGLIDTHVHMALEIKMCKSRCLRRSPTAFLKRLNDKQRFKRGSRQYVMLALPTPALRKRKTALSQVHECRLALTRLRLQADMATAGTYLELIQQRQSIQACLTENVDGREEVRKTVREMLRAGADVVKVHATGGVSSPTDHPEFTQFSQEELEVMVEEATFRKGVKVMAHAQGAEGIKNAVRAGIHSIEHGIYIDDEALELMLEHGTYLVPTLLAPLAVLEAAETSNTMAPYAIEKSKEVIDIHKESIKKAYEAGVKIAMGTDAGVFPHGINLRELGLMCEIGMSPMEAIVASTKTAAECMGWGEKVGTIEAGKWADLILLNSNPLEDIEVVENHENITFVMKDGQVFKDTLAKAASVTN
ncbi:LOW QUALITY PROTEIN: hypothetical protein JCM19046_3583 [Bacillus sp. JCM 19046]|nr:LOW QUALITY PROTEIN: hypothetical protein JCM19046_3583 [Bacillus sp. JCM 19046]